MGQEARTVLAWAVRGQPDGDAKRGLKRTLREHFEVHDDRIGINEHNIETREDQKRILAVHGDPRRLEETSIKGKLNLVLLIVQCSQFLLSIKHLPKYIPFHKETRQLRRKEAVPIRRKLSDQNDRMLATNMAKLGPKEMKAFHKGSANLV